MLTSCPLAIFATAAHPRLKSNGLPSAKETVGFTEGTSPRRDGDMSLSSLVLEFFRGKIRQIDREMGGRGMSKGAAWTLIGFLLVGVGVWALAVAGIRCLLRH